MNDIDDYDLIDKDWDLFIKKGLQAFGLDAQALKEDDQRDWNTRVVDCAEKLYRSLETGGETCEGAKR